MRCFWFNYRELEPNQRIFIAVFAVTDGDGVTGSFVAVHARPKIYQNRSYVFFHLTSHIKKSGSSRWHWFCFFGWTLAWYRHHLRFLLAWSEMRITRFAMPRMKVRYTLIVVNDRCTLCNAHPRACAILQTCLMLCSIHCNRPFSDHDKAISFC